MQLYSLRSLATDSNNDLDMVTDGLRPFVDRLCEKGAVVTCHGGGGGGYSPLIMAKALVGKFREQF